MSSFSESRAGKILAKGDDGFQQFVDYNKTFISRIYPKAVRFDSSNFDPILFWYAGCQLVALNIQTDSYPMWVNFAKFAENGRSGYTLRRFNFLSSNTMLGGAASLNRRKSKDVIASGGEEKFTRPISITTLSMQEGDLALRWV